MKRDLLDVTRGAASSALDTQHLLQLKAWERGTMIQQDALARPSTLELYRALAGKKRA